MKTGDIVFLRRPYKGYIPCRRTDGKTGMPLAGQDCRERS